MSIYDPVTLTGEGLKLTQPTGTSWNAPRTVNTALLREALRTSPHECATLTGAADLAICIDAYCSHQSKNGTMNPNLEIERFWTGLDRVLKTRHMAGLPQRAVIGRILNTFKDQFCKDQPPPPGTPVPIFSPVPAPVDLPGEAPVRSGNCGYAATLPPETKPGWLPVLGGFLGILAFRAILTATRAFFLFFEPEKHTSRPNIT